MEQEVKKLLTKVFNKTEDELDPILYEGEGEGRKLKEGFSDTLIDMFSQKVQSIKDGAKEEKENFYKKGVKETAESFETKFKELTGFEADGQFEDIVKSYVETSGKKTKLTDDDIKKHPLYIELEQSRVKKEDYERVKSEYEDYKKNMARNQVLNQIKSKAWNIVEQNKPQEFMPKYKEAYLSTFENYDFEINGDQIVVLENGKRKEDKLGNLITFESLAKSEADNWFKWNVTDARDGSGNKNEPQGKTGGFETFEQWSAAFNKEKDPKVRVEMGKEAREKGWLASQ